jgi:hypothetical protein
VSVASGGPRGGVRLRHPSNIADLVPACVARVSLPTPQRSHEPAPLHLRRRSGSPRWLALRRRTGWLPLFLGFVLVAAVPAWAGTTALPAGVPNLLDPAVRAHFQRVWVVNLQGNEDFPVVALVNTTGEEPRVLLLGLDARNGADTFSLATDPIILIMVVGRASTIQDVYVDIGFVNRGVASGTYAAVAPENASALLELLEAVRATGARSQT